MAEMGHQQTHSGRAFLVRFLLRKPTYPPASHAARNAALASVEAIGGSAVGAVRGHAPSLFDDLVGDGL
jgi:hypothetical protein